MNKRLWEAYLSIARKAETGGMGDDYSPPEGFVSEKIVDDFLQYVPSSKYPKVLNIGAGAGTETRLFADLGYKVLGITLGADNIKIAEEKWDIDLIEMDMHYLQFSPNTFDAILMVQTGEHALAIWPFILEMRFVLKDGGIVFTDRPDPNDIEQLKTIWHTNVLYPHQLYALYEKAGFELVKDLSRKHRVRMIFEKLPRRLFDMYDYVKHIEERRFAIYIEDGTTELIWNEKSDR